MNARKCVHAQKPYSSQAFAHESSKAGEEKKRDRKDRDQEADGKKSSPTKQKHIRGTKIKAYLGTAKVKKKLGKERLTYPSHRM